MTLSDHLTLVGKQDAFRTARFVLDTLQDIPFTVVGGWAVYAHGSTVPSVDLDIWIDSTTHDAVYGAFLEKHDLQLDAAGVLERLNLDLEYLDSDNSLFGTDESFRRGSLSTERRRLLEYEVPVLTGPDLLFAKAKAFHDRSQQWAIRNNPTSLASLTLRSPEEAAFIRSRQPEYWLRKAGKDLVDIKFLEDQGFSMGGPKHLRPLVQAKLDTPPEQLVAWGRNG